MKRPNKIFQIQVYDEDYYNVYNKEKEDDMRAENNF
jgi:hypothetical protein